MPLCPFSFFTGYSLDHMDDDGFEALSGPFLNRMPARCVFSWVPVIGMACWPDESVMLVIFRGVNMSVYIGIACASIRLYDMPLVDDGPKCSIFPCN